MTSFLLINFIIFLEIKKYIKPFKDLFLTLLTINLANLAFALGSVLSLFGLQKILANKVYAYSRWNN